VELTFASLYAKRYLRLDNKVYSFEEGYVAPQNLIATLRVHRPIPTVTPGRPLAINYYYNITYF
jgi:hypothetical protein